VLNDLEEAFGFDRAIVMEGGRVVEQGPMSELQKNRHAQRAAAN